MLLICCVSSITSPREVGAKCAFQQICEIFAPYFAPVLCRLAGLLVVPVGFGRA